MVHSPTTAHAVGPIVRITPLASGSAGNATLVHSGATTLLIDCGLKPEELEARLDAVGVKPKQLRAILLTHRHRDHIRGTTEFAAKHKIRIRGTRLTVRRVGSEARRRVHLVAPGGECTEGDLRARCFPLSHDVPETMGWRVYDGRCVYAHATDLGCADPTVVEGMTRCHALLLEFNYDEQLLDEGPYAAALKNRVRSDRGHLSNRQATDLLRQLVWPGLRQVFVAHVSATNNSPELALAAAREALSGSTALAVHARQDAPTAPCALLPPADGANCR